MNMQQIKMEIEKVAQNIGKTSVQQSITIAISTYV